MGKAAHDLPARRGGEGRKACIRTSTQDPWENDCGRDPFLDISDDDQQGTVDGEYIWPAVEEDEDD